MAQKTIKRNGEEFLVDFDGKVGTVKDERGTTVSIAYAEGERPFEVRITTGSRWGGWQGSLDGAIDYAISLCTQSRSFITRDDFTKQWENYLSESC